MNRRPRSSVTFAAILCLSALASTIRAQDKITSGKVLGPDGQPVTSGWVGLIFEASLADFAASERIWPDRLAELDEKGSFTFEFHSEDIRGRRFYLFSLSPRHQNRIFGALSPSIGLPRPGGFSAIGVRRFNDALDNRSLVFRLESSLSRYLVPMRNGSTRLATDVYRPVSQLPLPTIVVRTPYGKDQTVRPTWLTLFGYAVVVQDSRGRFQSGGYEALFRKSGWGNAQDGWDTIEWAAAQDFSIGRVGMWGSSALAINQYLAAGAAPPSLRCAFAIAGTGNLYDDLVFPGGVLRQSAIETWLKSIDRTDFLAQIESHPSKDGFWDILQLDRRIGQVDIPIYHVGGWFDFMLPGATGAFARLQTQGDFGARGRQRLFLGPWTHGGFFTEKQGQLAFPTGLDELDVLREAVRFFDTWLLDRDTGMESEAPVRFYTLGDAERPGAPGNAWQSSESWPPPSTPVALYLRGDGRLTAGPPTPSDAVTRLDYLADPLDPVPTLGGANFSLPSGPFDQRAIEARDDVLTFTSGVLEAPVEVTGDVRVRLFVSSTARDTDFMVKLLDVYPDGRSMLMQEGVLRARYRNGTEVESLLEPGRIYELFLDLPPISLIYDAGHRVRISVTSSNSSRFDVNPNTGEPFRQHTRFEVATNSVHCSEAQASVIILPVR
ncbi:MAG: CocE/NonD family hydrolase [Planctomycetota bacterium]